MEREEFKKGRKIQIMILLARNKRLTHSQICKITGILPTNLYKYRDPCIDFGFMKQVPEAKIKPPGEADKRIVYLELTRAGSALVDEIPQEEFDEYSRAYDEVI